MQGEISRGERTELEAGILFCDVRGFTSLSEKLGAQEMVMVMNRFFEVLGEAVVRPDAEILKFIGDAVDGMHRIARHLLDGKSRIKVLRFEKNPALT